MGCDLMRVLFDHLVDHAPDVDFGDVDWLLPGLGEEQEVVNQLVGLAGATPDKRGLFVDLRAQDLVFVIERVAEQFVCHYDRRERTPEVVGDCVGIRVEPLVGASQVLFGLLAVADIAEHEHTSDCLPLVIQHDTD